MWVSVQPSGVFAREKTPPRLPMDSTWPWPRVGRFSHGLITQRQKNVNIKVVRLMWEFDCLHFAQYMLMSPHGIGYKQTIFLTYIFIWKKWTSMGLCVAFCSIFTRKNSPRLSMQITWPWPPVGRFSHGLITVRKKKMWT